MEKIRAVILAGGSGERFWPLSTPERPKQFLNVFGGESLIRQSVSRLAGIVSPEDVFVVTSAALVGATRRELPEIPRRNIAGEPMRRDTGAAVALGVGMASRDGDPVVAVFSSDQLVSDRRRFAAVLRKACSVARRKDAITTIGIKPAYPSTAFGYVDPRRGVFVEKPDAAKAKKFVKAGYLWNAGMFIARASVFRSAFGRFAPDLLPLAEDPPRSRAALDAKYASLERISFDYAVMEPLSKSGGVAVTPGDFGWDDVGGFAAFDRYFPHDKNGNVLEGSCNVVDSEGNICVVRAAGISLLGVKNLVVVTTPDYVLVADKSKLGDMKKLFKKG